MEQPARQAQRDAAVRRLAVWRGTSCRTDRPQPAAGMRRRQPRNAGGGLGAGLGLAPCFAGSRPTVGLQGDPPYYSYQFNGVYYNPNVYYPPGVKYDGSKMTSYSSANSTGWTKVPVDAYGTTSGTINLLTGFPEAVSATARPSCRCTSTGKRNGIDTAVNSCTTWAARPTAIRTLCLAPDPAACRCR